MSRIWFRLHPRATTDHLGYIPEFIDPDDERPVAEQIAECYIGGWSPSKGLALSDGAGYSDPRTLKLKYPGDPLLLPLWCTRVRDELVVVYPYGYTGVYQPDLTFEVSRLD